MGKHSSSTHSSTAGSQAKSATPPPASAKEPAPKTDGHASTPEEEDNHFAAAFQWLLAQQQIKAISISKDDLLREIRQIPACDGKSFLHCREWAQLAFRILCQTNGQTVDEDKLSTYEERAMELEGTTAVELVGPGADDICSELETLLNGQMMNRGSSSTSKNQRPVNTGGNAAALLSNADDDGEDEEKNVEELLRNMKQSLKSWLDTKVNFSVPNAIFPPAVLPQQSKIPVVTQSRDPTQILRCAAFSKNNISVPRSNFTRLRQLLSEEIMAPRLGACMEGPSAQTPMEMERISDDYNDRIKSMKAKIESALQKHAAAMCNPLRHILDIVHDNMTSLHRIIGPRRMGKLISDSMESCDGLTLLPFSSYWHDFSQRYKNAPKFEADGEAVGDGVDMAMTEYFSFYRRMSVTVIPTITQMTVELTEFTAKYEATLSAMLQKLVELYGAKAPEEAQQLVAEARSSLSRCQAIVQSRIENGLRELEDRFTDNIIDCDDIWNTIKLESKCTATGRMERISKKDIRKRIKKLESSFQQDMRWFKSYFSTIFPSFYLVFLGYSVLRGYVHQLMFWQARVYEVMLDELQDSMDDIDQGMAKMDSMRNVGILSGTTDLSMILATLVWREIERQYEDWNTTQMQTSLLQEIQREEEEAAKKEALLLESATASGIPSAGESSKKKRKKKKKKGTMAANGSTAEDHDDAGTADGSVEGEKNVSTATTTPTPTKSSKESASTKLDRNDHPRRLLPSNMQFPPGFEILDTGIDVLPDSSDGERHAFVDSEDYESVADTNQKEHRPVLPPLAFGKIDVNSSDGASRHFPQSATHSLENPITVVDEIGLQQDPGYPADEVTAGELKVVQDRMEKLEEENEWLKTEIKLLVSQMSLVMDELQQSKEQRQVVENLRAQDQASMEVMRQRLEMAEKTAESMQQTQMVFRQQQQHHQQQLTAALNAMAAANVTTASNITPTAPAPPGLGRPSIPLPPPANPTGSAFPSRITTSLAPIGSELGGTRHESASHADMRHSLFSQNSFGFFNGLSPSMPLPSSPFTPRRAE